MRKALLFAFLIITGFAFAQNSERTAQVILNQGDTLRWKPEIQCNDIHYNVNGSNIIKMQPLRGGKIQVIGRKPGIGYLNIICSDTTYNIKFIVNDPTKVEAEKVTMDKPVIMPFDGKYNFNPPTDHFFITYTNPYSQSVITLAKIGDEEAFKDINGSDRFWNTTTGKNYYYRSDAQGWTPDVDWDFEAFGESFFPLNALNREVNIDSLANYYVGTKDVVGVNCWHFYVEREDGNVIQYWIDPANGCTLKRQMNLDAPCTVTLYNLNYRKWEFGPMYKKSLHDKTR